MTPLAVRALAVYVALVLVLAALGSHGQIRYRHHARLLETKDTVLVALAEARAEAAAVNGPLAIARWARATGMVPAPEAVGVMAVAPSPVPPPERVIVPSHLEIRTVWR
jgi:hypothetical protein